MAAKKQPAKPKKASTKPARDGKPSPQTIRTAPASNAPKPSTPKPSAVKPTVSVSLSKTSAARSGSGQTTKQAPAKSSSRVEAKAKTESLPAPSEAPLGRGPHDAVVQKLREFGLGYPEAHTKSPWPGHLDLAVRDKTFAYLSVDGEPLRVGCKLPHSCQAALSLPFSQPTPYGLGKSGWVTATFESTDEPPLEFLKEWIDESYRAVAPKSLVKRLPTVG